MTRRFFPNLIFPVFLLAVVTSAGASSPAFDRYHTPQEVIAMLKSYASKYPRLSELIPIGKSYQGRDIWAVILNNPKTGPAEHKPGYYIDSNELDMDPVAFQRPRRERTEDDDEENPCQGQFLLGRIRRAGF